MLLTATEQAALDAAENYIRATGPIPPDVDYFVEQRAGEWRVLAVERQRVGALKNGVWEVEVRMTSPGLALIEISQGQ